MHGVTFQDSLLSPEWPADDRSFVSCAYIYNKEDSKLFCYLTSVLHRTGLSLGKREGLM